MKRFFTAFLLALFLVTLFSPTAVSAAAPTSAQEIIWLYYRYIGVHGIQSCQFQNRK